MSLQVWLPLNGNLYNQGLTDVVLNSGTPTYTSGKIGQCLNTGTLKFDVSNNLITTIGSNKIYTICCWCKNLNTSASSRWVFMLSSGSGTSRGLWENNSTSYRYWAYSGSGTNISTSINAIDGKWHHICFVSNGSNVKLYVDGDYQSETNSANIAEMTSNIFQLNATDYNLNDFRIYDHCLSPQEVKQISKGLLLHYLLNRNGFGCENIFSYGSDCQTSLDNITQNTNKFIIVTEDGIKCAHAAGALTTEKKLQSKVGITPASQEIFTFSAWIKIKNITAGTTNPMCEFYFSGQTIDGTWRGIDYVDFRVDGKPISLSSIRFYASGWNINDGNWHYVSATCKYKNVTYTSTLYPAIYFRDCTGDLYIHHIKFERGANATPWCPAAGDDLYNAMGLNSLIEYDISGFGYNGTHVGSLAWSNDSPKYSASTVFDGASYIVTTPEWMTQGAEEYTISIWAYMDDWTNYPGRMYSCIQTGGFCDEKSGNNLQWAIHTYSNAEQTTAAYTSGTYCTYPFASITPGWHMFTWTYTTSVIKGYIDGEVVSTKTITTYGIHFNTDALLALGAESAGATITSPYFTGKLSDFRLYATALSASDVKSLYQNSAYIDSNGIIHGAIH